MKAFCYAVALPVAVIEGLILVGAILIMGVK
jgi:hypothetical protein